jgi:hypothetical protein
MIESENNECEHCWEFMNCTPDTRIHCFAYKSKTEEPCWVLNLIAKKDGCKILFTCKGCPWFLKNNP